VHVGVSFLVAGATMYGFLTLAARALGPSRYSILGVIWAVSFVAGPGLFFSLEQELARQVSARMVHRRSARSLLRDAAAGGALIVAAVALPATVFWDPLARSAFQGDRLAVAVSLLVVLGAFVEHFGRGLLAGRHKFRGYATLLGGSGLARLLLCFALAASGVESPGGYGLALALPSFLAGPVALREYALACEDRREAGRRWTSLLSEMLQLAAASLAAYALLSGPILGVTALVHVPAIAASRLIACFVFARIPLFTFGAIQATLVPSLSAALASENRGHFRRLTRNTVAFVAISATGFTLLVRGAGPWLVNVLFGPGYALDAHDMTLLASASGFFVLGLAVAQALIALEARGRIVASWLTGFVLLVLSLRVDVGADGVRRVEWGFLAACMISCALLGFGLWRAVRRSELA
jgi:O-antigen/teichoic acid export membrane protein